ncbi:hypothetical protein [Bradyrhizobium sp. 930_D9_N1_4]|uniref:hypothetical protein n=1 Tax=Bradyrhizobium sp. 930_D9_N1_4 TaxID=3240374 RepID=UPI003F8A59B9
MPRPYANPEVAARKWIEIAAGIEPTKDGRKFIEKINAPFLFTLKAKGSERCEAPRPLQVAKPQSKVAARRLIGRCLSSLAMKPKLGPALVR